MPEAKLIPAKGRTVPLDDGAAWPLDDKGKPIARTVELTRFYRRRLKDGDLLLVDEDEAPAQAEAGPAANSAEANPAEDETKTKGGRSGARKES